jgi:hypothetical protein
MNKNVVEAVAKAIWEASRSSELKQVSDFDFDDKIFINTAKILKNSTPREEVSLCFSLISKSIDSAIRFHFSHASKKEIKELMGGLGPLASDASRIRLLKALGWLHPQLCDAINSFRKIRNTLSHEIIDFNNKEPNFLPEETLTHFDNIYNRINDALFDSEKPKMDMERLRSISGYGIVLSSETMEEIIMAPSKLRLGIGSKRGSFYSDKDCPKWVRKLHLATADSLIILSNYE